MLRKAVKTVFLFVFLCSWFTFSLGQSGSGSAYADDDSTSYEAEAAGNTLTGNASAADCEACSGGSKVGNLYQGASVQFNGVTASAAGSYTVTVYYTSGDPRSANVSANGGEKEYVDFPATADWDTVGSYDVTLELQAGANAILIDDNNWYAPDIDRIVVHGASGSDGGGDNGGGDNGGGTEPQGTVYEAEAAGNTLTGNASAADCEACSGGSKVGNLYQGASVQFNGVTASAAGSYTVTVYYTSGDPRSANVSANGGEKEYVDFPATADWDTVGSYDVTLELQAGANAILIDDNNWYAPDIDRIVVHGASGSDGGGDNGGGDSGNGGGTEPQGTVYEAEAAGNTLTGNASAADCEACSGGSKVGGLYGGSSLLFPNVTADAAGDYEVELSFISGDPRAFYVSVNGGEAEFYDALKTADWNTLGTYTITVQLQAGVNQILFSDGNGYSPDLDCIAVRPASSDEQPGQDEGSIGDALTPTRYGPVTVTPYTAGAVISTGDYSVTYHTATGYADYEWTGGQKVTGVSAQIKLDGQTLQSTDYATHSFSVQDIAPISDGFGQGIEVVFVNEADGKPTLRQVYDFYDGKAYFLTRLDAVSATAIATNYMAPIAVERTDAVKSGQGANDRVLTVPFDNDNWVRFKAQNVNRSDTSYEVTAVYDNDSRTGLVIGSVTHDKWKTGIDWSGSGGTLNRMTVYGGASASGTHDSQPHGSLSGTTVSSPTIMAGGFADYRDGLEEYGQANAVIAPPLSLSADLPQGVPVGWNSWGAFGSNLSYQDVIDTSNYFKNNLPDMNDQGAVYINLDSYWDNLSDEQLQQAVSVIKGNGQNAGIYWGPFVYWGNNMSQTVEGTDGQYTYGDIVLKDASGNPLPTLDGAYALDPTNPGTKQRIDYYLGRFKNLGFTYIKLDFLTHGSLEGVHADPAVTTGIAAYNEGMAYIDQTLDGSMFISESISPIFPSQYANSRRISCDTYGQINETEYELNSLTYGWWQNGTIYTYTDPDHMALTRANSLTEARSRVNSAVISGTVFLDSDDVNDATAQQYMEELYGNPLVNALAVRGEAFRPVEGNTGANAADTFVLKDGDAAYVAVFNYNGNAAADKTIDLSRLGLSAGTTYATLDLWTGETGTASGTLAFSLQPAESRLIKLTPPAPVVAGPQPGSSAAQTSTDEPQTPEAQQQMLDGAAGGSLKLEEQLEADVPAGAFAGEREFTARELAADETPAASGQTALSPAFELLGGDAGAFQAPVRLTFHYDAAALGGNGNQPAVYYYSEKQKRWIYMGGTDNGDGTVSVSTNHFTVFAVFSYQPHEFADLNGHWAQPYAERLIGMGAVRGFADGTFRPDAAVTRAQFAAMLASALGLQAEPGQAAAFADQAAVPDWARDAVEAVRQAGLMRGAASAGGPLFRPGAAITRAELAQTLAPLLADADAAAAEPAPESAASAASFADADAIPAWAAQAAAAAERAGVLTGFADGTFRPSAAVSRGEAAKALALLLERLMI